MGERGVAPADRQAVDGQARIEAEEQAFEALGRRSQPVLQIEQQRLARFDPHLAAHFFDIRLRFVLGSFVRRCPGVLALHLIETVPCHGTDQRRAADAERDGEQQLLGDRLVPARVQRRRADQEGGGEQHHAETLNQVRRMREIRHQIRGRARERGESG